MLCLMRRSGESIVFTTNKAIPAGTRFKLELLNIDRNQARLGIDAPKSITVDREEIDKRKRLQAGEIDGNVAEPVEDEALED